MSARDWRPLAGGSSRQTFFPRRKEQHPFDYRSHENSLPVWMELQEPHKILVFSSPDEHGRFWNTLLLGRNLWWELALLPCPTCLFFPEYKHLRTLHIQHLKPVASLAGRLLQVQGRCRGTVRNSAISPFYVHLKQWSEMFWVGPFEMYLRMKRPHMKSQLLYAPCKPPSYQIFKSLIFLSLPFSLRKRVRIHLLVIICWDLPHTPQKQMSGIHHQLGSLSHAVWDKERSLASWHTWNGI